MGAGASKGAGVRRSEGPHDGLQGALHLVQHLGLIGEGRGSSSRQPGIKQKNNTWWPMHLIINIDVDNEMDWQTYRCYFCLLVSPPRMLCCCVRPVARVDGMHQLLAPDRDHLRARGRRRAACALNNYVKHSN